MTIFVFIIGNEEDDITLLSNFGDLGDCYVNDSHVVNGYYDGIFTQHEEDSEEFIDIEEFLEATDLYNTDFEDDKKITDKHIDALIKQMGFYPHEVIKIRVDDDAWEDMINLIRLGKLNRFFSIRGHAFRISEYETILVLSNGRLARCYRMGDHLGDFVYWRYYKTRLIKPIVSWKELWESLYTDRLGFNEYPLDTPMERQIHDAVRVLGYDNCRVRTLIEWQQNPDIRLEVANELIFGRQDS